MCVCSHPTLTGGLLLGMTVFLLFPFSRLVHIWSVPLGYVQRPYRIRIKSKPEHALILGVMLSIGLTGFATEAFRIAIQGMRDFEKWSFIGYPLAKIFEDAGYLVGAQRTAWVLHIASFIVFIVILPSTMLRHIFTSPMSPNVFHSTSPSSKLNNWSR